VPRVVNAALGTFLLLLLAPAVTTWDSRPTAVRVTLVLFGTPFVLVALMCLASAARPGSVARAARRLRRRR
jgi:hypothetical protein